MALFAAAFISGPVLAASVSVVKTQTGGEGVGVPIHYEIQVTNTGISQIDDLIVVDTLSPIIVNATTTQPAGFGAPMVAYMAGTGTRYVWTGTGIAMAPLSTLTFAVDSNIGLTCTAKIVSNTAFVIASDAGGPTTAFSNPVGCVIQPPQQKLTITKTQTPAAPVTGSPLNYTIVVTNSGAMTIDSIVVVDTLSAAITNVNVMTPPGFTARPIQQMPSGTMYSWASTAPLLPGGSATFQLDGTVGFACVPKAISNTAYMVANAACSTTRIASNSTGFILDSPVMSFTAVKQQTPASPVPGGPVSYQLVITNTGGATITSLTVVDTVSPVVTSPVTASPPGWAAPVVANTASGTRFVWSAAGISFTPGTSTVFTIAGVVGYSAGPRAVSNTAFIVAGHMCAVVTHTTNVVGFVHPGNTPFYRIQAPPVVGCGIPFWITVIAFDSAGGTKVDYCGTTSFTSTDPAATILGAAMDVFDYAWSSSPGLCGGAPFDNGVRLFVNVVLGRPGTTTITATDTVTASMTDTTSVQVACADVKLWGTPRVMSVQATERVRFTACWSNYGYGSAFGLVLTNAVPQGTDFIPEASVADLDGGNTDGIALGVAYSTSPLATMPPAASFVAGNPVAGTRWLRWTAPIVGVGTTGCGCFRVRVQ